MIVDHQQTDFYQSGEKTFLLAMAGLGFAAAGFCAIWFRWVAPGSFKQFVMYACIPFGLLGILKIALQYRTGPTISVGTLGLFDRR